MRRVDHDDALGPRSLAGEPGEDAVENAQPAQVHEAVYRAPCADRSPAAHPSTGDRCGSRRRSRSPPAGSRPEHHAKAGYVAIYAPSGVRFSKALNHIASQINKA